MYKNNILLALFLFLSGCAQLAFNERFAYAEWEKVLIAPFDGNLSIIAEDEFEHALAVSSTLVIVSSSMVKSSLKANELEDEYKVNPQEAMFKLASILKADGIVFARIESFTTEKRSRSDISTSSASIRAKLVGVDSKAIVASSQYDTQSIFSGENKMVRDVSKDAIEDLQYFFNKVTKR